MAIDLHLHVPVAAPPAVVFSVLTDPSRLHEWQTEVVGTEVLGGGPLVAGARLRETRRVMGREVSQVVEVQALEPPERFALRVVEGRIEVHGDWRLEPSDAGTALHVHAFGAGPRLLQPVLRRQLRLQHDRLRALAEAA